MGGDGEVTVSLLGFLGSTGKANGSDTLRTVPKRGSQTCFPKGGV